VKKKPPYAVESVDNALRILALLRDSGPGARPGCFGAAR
jgi:hypothetical protein